MAAEMLKRGLEVDHFRVELDKIRALPGFRRFPFPTTTPLMLSELAGHLIDAASP